ncbi:unnamed protein product [Symbiodinium sp. CCMP2592]|nr:unnamed protein product [Symbiodinium sp. CCMP2592]
MQPSQLLHGLRSYTTMVPQPDRGSILSRGLMTCTPLSDRFSKCKAFRGIASLSINRMAEAGLLRLGRFGMKLLFDKIVQWIEEQLLAKVLSNIIGQIGKMLEAYILSWFSPACSAVFNLVDDASSLVDDLNGYWVTPLTARLLPFVLDLLSPIVARMRDYFFDLFYVNLAKPILT